MLIGAFIEYKMICFLAKFENCQKKKKKEVQFNILNVVSCILLVKISILLKISIFSQKNKKIKNKVKIHSHLFTSHLYNPSHTKKKR